MIKNKSMNKKIALIIAVAVTVGQIPVSALAENNTTLIVENSQVENVEKASEEYAYNQEYDNYSSTSWTSLIGNGTIVKNMDNDVPDTEGKTGYLEISRDATANNQLVFLENQSPSIKDFEAEVRFQLNPEEGKAAGRFGLALEGKMLILMDLLDIMVEKLRKENGLLKLQQHGKMILKDQQLKLANG